MKIRQLIFLYFLLGTTVLYAQERASVVPLEKAADSTGTADYLSAIQRSGQSMESTRTSVKPSLAVIGTIAGVKKAQEDLLLVTLNLSGNGSGDMRNLKMYKNVLSDLRQGLSQQDSVLRAERTRLAGLMDSVSAIFSDSVVKKLTQEPELQERFSDQIITLQSQYKTTDSLVQYHYKQAEDYLTISAQNRILLDKTNAEISAIMEKNSLSQEYSPIWSINKISSISAAATKERTMSESLAFLYYLKYRMGAAIFSIILLILGGWWMRRTSSFVASSSVQTIPISGFYTLRLFGAGAVLATTVLIYGNLEAPASMAAVLLVFQTLAVGFLIQKHWDKASFRIWLLFSSLFIIALLLDLLVKISFTQRLLFIAINVFTIINRKKLTDSLLAHTSGQTAFKAVRALLLWLNVIALLCNIFGAVTIAQSFTLAAFIVLAEWFALSVCIKIIIESLILQLRGWRLRKGISAEFDQNQLSESFSKPLLLLQGWLLVLILATSLNFWDSLKNILDLAYHYKATIGDLTISVGSVTVFLVVLWLAHLAQRFVEWFFGNSASSLEEARDKKQHSKMLITRLVVLVAGYLLAILASGVPLDKISIAIGALGVGVGLGLQNIVNNFVSGVILIFDKSVQVGDMIDFGGREGRVKSIDLRTTKLDVNNGAEVIIPNGNLLSQNITNWTYSSYNRLASLSMGLSGELNREEIIKTVEEALGNISGVLSERQEVFFTNIGNGTYEISVQFWCSIYKLDQTLSESRLALYNAFSKKGILVTWK